jgi:hypothetical protein
LFLLSCTCFLISLYFVVCMLFLPMGPNLLYVCMLLLCCFSNLILVSYSILSPISALYFTPHSPSIFAPNIFSLPLSYSISFWLSHILFLSCIASFPILMPAIFCTPTSQHSLSFCFSELCQHIPFWFSILLFCFSIFHSLFCRAVVIA